MALPLHRHGARFHIPCSILSALAQRLAAIRVSRSFLVGLAAASLVFARGGTSTVVLNAQASGTTPGAIRAYSTFSSIGVEWDIVGDANHNAAASVEFRVTGTSAWRAALPLVRVDYNGANTLAGSVLFLSPGTSYDVRLTLTDPDGGTATQTFAFRDTSRSSEAGLGPAISRRARRGGRGWIGGESIQGHRGGRRRGAGGRHVHRACRQLRRADQHSRSQGRPRTTSSGWAPATARRCLPASTSMRAMCGSRV